jgi:uncharacterized SAM-binding protein YcdF (DUF218 family)
MIDSALAGRKILEALLLPPGGPLVFTALAFLAARRFRWAQGLVWAGLAATWLLATDAVGVALCESLEREVPALTDAALKEALAGPHAPRAVVVLGGGAGHDAREQPASDVLQPATLSRLLAGVRLARQTGLPLLVSGGAVQKDRPAEAALMAQVAGSQLGLAPRFVEDRSLDTPGNARLSAQMLAAQGIGSVVLVTSAFHMPRARALFQAQGIEVLGAPIGFSGTEAREDVRLRWLASETGMRLSRRAANEWAGRSWYWLAARLGLTRLKDGP